MKTTLTKIEGKFPRKPHKGSDGKRYIPTADGKPVEKTRYVPLVASVATEAEFVEAINGIIALDAEARKSGGITLGTNKEGKVLRQPVDPSTALLGKDRVGLAGLYMIIRDHVTGVMRDSLDAMLEREHSTENTAPVVEVTEDGAIDIDPNSLS
jgi:hypothetical protein